MAATALKLQLRGAIHLLLCCTRLNSLILSLTDAHRSQYRPSNVVIGYFSSIPFSVTTYPLRAGHNPSWHCYIGKVACLSQDNIHAHIQNYGQFSLIYLTCMSCLWTLGGSRSRENTQTLQRTPPHPGLQPRTFLLWGNSTNHCPLIDLTLKHEHLLLKIISVRWNSNNL